MFEKIDTVIIRVRDLARARQWYQETLGLSAVFSDDRERLVTFGFDGGTSLTIWELAPGEVPNEQGVARSFPIFFGADIDGIHATLAGRGVRVDPIQGEAGGTRWFALWDPDGNRLEVCRY